MAKTTRPRKYGVPAYVVFYTVAGSGEFPFDMLRYDASHPANESEARDLGACHEDIGDELRSVRLMHVGAREWQPTERRWMSFGWAVIEVRANDYD